MIRPVPTIRRWFGSYVEGFNGTCLGFARRRLPGRAERARIKAQRKEERAQADAANQQNAADDTAASLVDDKNAISMDDVMSYAGGLRSSFGAAADVTSKNVGESRGVDGSTKKRRFRRFGWRGSESAGSMPISGWLAKSEFAPNNGDLIDETVGWLPRPRFLDGAMQSGLSAGLQRRLASRSICWLSRYCRLAVSADGCDFWLFWRGPIHE